MNEQLKIAVVNIDGPPEEQAEHTGFAEYDLSDSALVPDDLNSTAEDGAPTEYRSWLWDQIQENNTAVIAELNALTEQAMSEEGVVLDSAVYPDPSYADVVVDCIQWLASHGFSVVRNQLFTGDAVELMKQIPDNAIDLIFTDPPYIKEQIAIYGWLAEEAIRVLKPDGFLMAYVGSYWKCDVMALLRAHMTYFWDYIIIHGADLPLQRNRNTRSATKSILCYRKPESDALPHFEAISAFSGTGQSKAYHEWGQPIDEAQYYISCFSRPKNLVLDPFIGGGTTAVACNALSRYWIGFELDPAQAEIARRRIAEDSQPGNSGYSRKHAICSV